MKTNFFEALESLNVKGVFNIAIQIKDDDQVIASVLFNPEISHKEQQKSLPPMLFTGTSEHLGETFFEELLNPVKKTAEGFINKAHYEKALQEAIAPKKSEKSTKKSNVEDDQIETAPAVSKEEMKKNYEEAMKKIEEFNGLCKYEDALKILPSEIDYPEKEKELKKMAIDLDRKAKQYADQLQLL
ncbi:hypothetical protein [Pedobacter sp. WC2423]|uniref:hypothetical protein n=1 Tax=Pedobacter sp. WC2423 TaxID=3234142 RepID=UPI003465CE98